MKQKEIFLMAAGLFVGAGLAVFVYYLLDFGDGNPEKAEEIPGVNIPGSVAAGSPAPDFELMKLDDETLKLSELRGKIVLINFWATWCEPCKIEMPLFEKLNQTDSLNLEILAINFDEPPLQVEQYADEYQLNFPILLDPGGEVQKLYRVIGYPTTFFIDDNGMIRYHHIGLITEDQLDHYLTDMGAIE